MNIEQIAKISGVSRSTVSRVINNDPNVSERTRTRVQKIIRQVNYQPNAAARHLATSKTRTIGLMLTSMHDDFFAPLLTGIEATVRDQEYNLLVAAGHINGRNGAPLPLGPHNADGLIIFADSLSDKHLHELHTRDFPMVLIHRTPPRDLSIPSVTVENQAATQRMIDHLVEVHNKRRILFMAGLKDQEDSQWRENGYRLALEAHVIPYDPGLQLSGEFNRDVAYRNLKAFIAHRPLLPFDSIFAGDDEAAIGCMMALTEAGYRVPADVAVVGFDDMRISAYLSPPLTTVRAPTEEVGRVATRQLFQLLAGRPAESVTLLPTEIIIRRSCGCNA